MSAGDAHRVRLRGTVPVALAPVRASELFTPSGERRWADGWDPVFPAATADDTEPGTVFQIGAPGPVTWVVAARDPGRLVRYALVEPGRRAGTVEVKCAAGEPGTIATVTYDMTALSESGVRWLAEFAAGYETFLASWRDAIAATLASG
jgi:hypothetical protein